MAVSVTLPAIGESVTEGSVTRAAERLWAAQSTVSAGIDSLERTFGVRLFDRSVRPPALTLIGQAAGSRAAALLESAHRFEDEFRFSGMRRMPLLRIGIPDEIAGAAVFMGSAAGDFMTGQTVVIDGGATIS